MPASALTATATGVPAGLSFAVTATSGASTLPGTRTWTFTGSVSASPGTYPVLVSVSDSDANVGTTSFTIVVTKAPLTVTADSKSRLFGASNPPLTATITGFVLGQSPATSGVTGSASCTTTATQFSPGGGYPITCTVGTLSAANYTFSTFVPGTLTVTYSSPCISGTSTGVLTVPAGQAVCVGPNANVTGPVTIGAGGSLDVEGGRITGPVTATGAAVVRMCGTTLTGPLTVTGITGLVLVGGDAATGACAGNFVVGPVTLTGNTAGVEFNGNVVIGSVRITGNTGTLPPPDTGPVHAAGNTVIGPAQIQA